MGIFIPIFGLDISYHSFLLVNTLRYDCSDCGGPLIQTESDIVCKNCGLVADKIYEKPALQLIKTDRSYGSTYASISKRPSTMKSLGSYIGAYRKNLLTDIQGSQLKIPAKRQFKRLKPLNDIYLHFDGRQREYRGHSFLTTICSILQITDAAKADALYLFQSVHSHLRGELKLSSLIMGSLYLAIRSRKENIELARLVAAAQNRGYFIHGKDIVRAASLIRQHAKIRVSHVKSEEYLGNIIGRLERDPEILKKVQKKIRAKKSEYFQYLKLCARELLKNFPKTDRGGRNPFILAVAIIVAADVMLARQKIVPRCYKRKSRRGIITQKQAALILNLAEFTLREHYLELAKPLMEAEIQKQERISKSINNEIQLKNTERKQLDSKGVFDNNDQQMRRSDSDNLEFSLSTNKTREILKLLKDNPIEWSISQIAKKSGLSMNKVHNILCVLIDLEKIIPTRKEGKIQFYCFKEYEKQLTFS